MQKNLMPLVVLYGYRGKKRELHFNGRTEVITLMGNVSKLESVLQLCNGMNTVAEIASALPGMDPALIDDILSTCVAEGVVVDSRETYRLFHQDSENPMLFLHDLAHSEISQLMQSPRLRERRGESVGLPPAVASNALRMIRTRKSTRRFVARQIPAELLCGILEATHGVSGEGDGRHWSIPSGGALYPLDIYVIIPGDDQTIAHGVYRWDPEMHDLIRFTDSDPRVWLHPVLNVEAVLENAACIICIAANFSRSTSKYANRGYRYAVLEAGHAAQNAYLYCAEQHLGVVEFGGWNDASLARELGLKYPDEAVITTLVIGTGDPRTFPSPSCDLEIMETAQRLRHMLVGAGKPIANVYLWAPTISSYVMPRWGATASVRSSAGRSKKVTIASATGRVSNVATIKALAEGFERYALEQCRVDCEQEARSLTEPYLDPRTIVPYADHQYRFLDGLEPFDSARRIPWVAGERHRTGERVWVPTDLVFYGPTVRRGDLKKLLTHANSSGVAAHFDRNTAVNNAMYELIERDAIGVTWYAKRPVRAVAHRYLPDDFRFRIAKWESLGYKISLLDLTLDGPSVAAVLIWSAERTPALITGAGCRPSFLDAAYQALSEAELLAISWHRRRPKRTLRMQAVRSVEHHGLFYIDPRNLKYVKWLLCAEEGEMPTLEFHSVLERFAPIVVDITPQEHICGLSVVRVLSEHLMPITFGYGSEHYRHPRLATLGLTWKRAYPSVPHFFP